MPRRLLTFLISLGKSALKVLHNLVAPAKIRNKNFDEITAALLPHYEPRPLVVQSASTSINETTRSKRDNSYNNYGQLGQFPVKSPCSNHCFEDSLLVALSWIVSLTIQDRATNSESSKQGLTIQDTATNSESSKQG